MSYEYVTKSGVIVSDTSEIKTEVETEWKQIAGEDSTVDPSSFEGRLIDMFTNERVGVSRNDVGLANQFNPNMAQKVFLDAHLANIGSKRDGKERSTCECVLTGIVGTIITAGSIAQDDNKNSWFLVDDATIGTGNTVTASFRSSEYGAISASIGEINKIVTGVVGWETINNEVDATEGKTEQSDVSARRQRVVELGANSRSVSYSVIAAVSKVENVEGVQFRENTSLTTQTIDGVEMVGKSSWLCVDGGVTSEIVDAYVPNRWGTDFNGAVEYEYTDPSNGQEFTVKLDRPTDKPLQCKVTARVSQSQNADSDIKKAVVDYANGLVDGELGFALGEDASPFEVAAAVNEQLSDVFIKKCELTEVGGTFSTDTITNAIYEKSSITESDVTVILV